MNLIHLTSERWLASIQESGIQPGDVCGHGNWTLASRPGLVYLTDCHAVHYMMAAANHDSGHAPALIEVEVSRKHLLPDEDYLGQVEWRRTGGDPQGRATAAVRRAEHRRLLDITSRLDPREHRHLWRDSLGRLGTVAHDGPIGPERIRRVVVVRDLRLLAMLDASNLFRPSLESHAMYGQQMRELTSLIAGHFRKLRGGAFTGLRGEARRIEFAAGQRTLVTPDGSGGWLTGDL